MRNLDISTLRSFVAVVDSGGVTRAAGFLHLTQSAVSMQLKRLEEVLDITLFDRSGRSLALTSAGEHLLVYARRMIDLNDEVMRRLTDTSFEGEIRLGVPHDIVYPAIPRVLKVFHAAFPRVKVHLISSNTKALKEAYAKGACETILTTEIGMDAGGEELCVKPLNWIGAPGGSAWRQRPLKLAFGRQCTFRPSVIASLDEANIPWERQIETDSDRTNEATVSADLAVHAVIEGTEPPHLVRIDHNGSLPALPDQRINLYSNATETDEVRAALHGYLRQAFFAADNTVQLRRA